MSLRTIPYAVSTIVLSTIVLPSGATDDPPIPAPIINSDSSKPMTIPKWRVTGRVITPDGRPLGKVTVWIVASYGVIRRYQETFQTETDTNGWFRVEGLPGMQVEMRAYAISSKRPWASVQFHTTKDENVVPDLVLPERGSSLTVRTVDEGGKPIAGANVVPALDNDGALDMFSFEKHSLENANTLRQALRPQFLTGDDGVARFSNLPSGNYTVRAIWVPKNTHGSKTSKLFTIEGEYYTNGGEGDTKSGFCKYAVIPNTDGGECTVQMRKVL